MEFPLTRSKHSTTSPRLKLPEATSAPSSATAPPPSSRPPRIISRLLVLDLELLLGKPLSLLLCASVRLGLELGGAAAASRRGAPCRCCRCPCDSSGRSGGRGVGRREAAVDGCRCTVEGCAALGGVRCGSCTRAPAATCAASRGTRHYMCAARGNSIRSVWSQIVLSRGPVAGRCVSRFYWSSQPETWVVEWLLNHLCRRLEA